MTDQLQPTQIKMTKSQWDFLKKLGQELGYHDGRGDHSRLVREIVSAAVTKWKESPYICRSSKHVVLVNRDGDVFYRQIQILKLNKQRERLPCQLQIKREKKDEYLYSCPKGMDESEWFRSHWLFNHFAVWHGVDAQGVLLDTHVDLDGIDSKMADLLVEQGPGSILTREISVGLQEFVQWRGEKRGSDRVGFSVHIPTRNLEILVAVDIDLYRKSPLGKDEIPNLELEFRNPESARFEGEGLARDHWNPMENPLVGRCLKEGDPNWEEVREHLQDLRVRIVSLAEAEDREGRPVMPQNRRTSILEACSIPQSFLYYKLAWASPYFGVDVCVRWERPVKVR